VNEAQLNTEILACRRCRRLTNQFKKLKDSHPEYWNRPVLASGKATQPLMIVGLAPGMHGANRTGVPFTGDSSGDLLFDVLDELDLADKVRITNAVKCLPIKNLPSSKEVKNCSRFLVKELDQHVTKRAPVLLALGGVAHRAVISMLGLRQADYSFGHGAVHRLDNLIMIDSYHCSRYNTQTGRLTRSMFRSVIKKAAGFAYP
jgi:uracil-DNA glycosylase family 4